MLVPMLYDALLRHFMLCMRLRVVVCTVCVHTECHVCNVWMDQRMDEATNACMHVRMYVRIYKLIKTLESRPNFETHSLNRTGSLGWSLGESRSLSLRHRLGAPGF